MKNEFQKKTQGTEKQMKVVNQLEKVRKIGKKQPTFSSVFPPPNRQNLSVPRNVMSENPHQHARVHLVLNHVDVRVRMKSLSN